MPIPSLRRVLNAVLRVEIDSKPATIQLIQQQLTKRALASQAKGKTPPPNKAPAIVPSLSNVPSLEIRPIDLLRKIGDLTTPSAVNMAALSASWATRRYFWAIDEPRGPQPKFKLSRDARTLDFHQKTLLSDEFGIGFGGLVLESQFQASEVVDVSAALQNSAQYQNVRQTGTAQPDYLMWNPDPNTPYYVVECKGCQTSRSAALNQIRRGLEQVPSLVFGTTGRRVNTLVVATLMQRGKTVVYVIDPPEPPDDEESSEAGEHDAIYERTGKNVWKIRDPVRFANQAWSAKQTKLLNWAGQFASAASVFERSRASRQTAMPAKRGRSTRQTKEFADLDLIHHNIRGVTYRGRRVPLFPEMGYGHLQVFTGVQAEILERARNPMVAADQAEAALRMRPPVTQEGLEANVSVGRDGTCLIVEGL